MAVFSGKIIEAYYTNADSDTIEVIYKEGKKAISFYLPVDYEHPNYQDLIKEYSSEEISKSTLARNKIYVKQIKEMVETQIKGSIFKTHKTNIADFIKILLDYNPKEKLHLDMLFSLKVHIFEMPEIKENDNKELKGKIRSSKNPLEILSYYKELIDG